MTLGINGWRLLGQRTGVGRYLLEILRRWDDNAVASRFDEIVLYTPRSLDQEDVRLPAGIRQKVIGPDSRMLVWENIAFGPRAGHDVVFCPSFSRPLIVRGRPVVSLHEATYRLRPELFPRVHWYSIPSLYLGLYGWSARHAAAVITTSYVAKDDIVRAYRVPSELIHVCYLAPSPTFVETGSVAALSAVRKSYLGDDVPFFLHVGTLSPVRNVPKIVEAFARLKRDRRLPHKLVLVGRNHLGVDLAALAGSLGVADDCIAPGYVPDADLVLLYNAATAFVLPYAYHTISLPPLEAMACGTPVILMDTAGLRETTGGAAHYIPDATVEEIAGAMLHIATDDGYAQELTARGRSFVSQLSWGRTADETLDVLHRAGERSRT